MTLEVSGSTYFKSALLNFSGLFSDFLPKSRIPSKHTENSPWQNDRAAEQPNTPHLKDLEEPTQSLSTGQPQLSTSSIPERASLPTNLTEENVLHGDSKSSTSVPNGEVQFTNSPSLSYIPDGPILGVNIELALETLRQKIRSKINTQSVQRKKALKSKRAVLAKKSAQEKKVLSRRQLKNLKKRQKKERGAKLLQSSEPGKPAESTLKGTSNAQTKEKGVTEPTSPRTQTTKNKTKGPRNKGLNLDLNYGKFVISDSEEHAADCIYPRSKRQLKERRLEELTIQREFIEKDPKRRREFKTETVWDHTAKRLSGINPKDEIEVLKKTIKNKDRDKRRSARKWEERMKTVDANIKARQEKRAANINNRIKVLKEKKLLAVLKRKQKKGTM